jgi:hypothetical protein
MRIVAPLAAGLLAALSLSATAGGLELVFDTSAAHARFGSRDRPRGGRIRRMSSKSRSIAALFVALSLPGIVQNLN